MEEKVSKMKGLLVKTKKELAESKKNVSISQISFMMTSYYIIIGGETRGNHTTVKDTNGVQSTTNRTV